MITVDRSEFFAHFFQDRVTIGTIHAPEADHLEEVIEEMRTLGAPTIYVLDTCWGLHAIEGVHRLNAAKALGLTPSLLVLEDGDYDLGQTVNSIAVDSFRFDTEVTFEDLFRGPPRGKVEFINNMD